MLEPAGFWVGPGPDTTYSSKVSATSRSAGRWILPGISITSFHELRATATPFLPRRSPEGQPEGLALTPYKVAVFALGPGEHETLCVPSKNGVSLSQSLVELLQSSLLPFKAKCSGAPPPITRTSSSGRGHGWSVLRQRTLTVVGEFLWIIPWFVAHPPREDLIMFLVCLSYCLVGFLLYILQCRISSLLKWSVSCPVVSGSLQPHGL